MAPKKSAATVAASTDIPAPEVPPAQDGDGDSTAPASTPAEQKKRGRKPGPREKKQPATTERRASARIAAKGPTAAESKEPVKKAPASTKGRKRKAAEVIEEAKEAEKAEKTDDEVSAEVSDEPAAKKAKPASKSVSKPASKAASKPASRAASKPPSKSAKPTSKSAKPVSKSTKPPSKKPASTSKKPTSKAEDKENTTAAAIPGQETIAEETEAELAATDA